MTIPFDYLSSYRAAIEKSTLDKSKLAYAYLLRKPLSLVVGRVDELLAPCGLGDGRFVSIQK